MRTRRSWLIAFGLSVALATACGDDEPVASQPAPPETTPPPPAPTPAPKEPAAPTVDAGASGLHLDDDTMAYRPRPTSSDEGPHSRIEIVLRSTPPGATAAVDGAVVGTTPTYWSGEADGRPREFTFVQPGYAMARYRFVPTRSGVVHGTLKRLTLEVSDAGPP